MRSTPLLFLLALSLAAAPLAAALLQTGDVVIISGGRNLPPQGGSAVCDSVAALVVLHPRDGSPDVVLREVPVTARMTYYDAIRSIAFFSDGKLVTLAGDSKEIPSALSTTTALTPLGDQILAVVSEPPPACQFCFPGPPGQIVVRALPLTAYMGVITETPVSYIDAIDVAADRCTLFHSGLFTLGSSPPKAAYGIGRYDICTDREDAAPFAGLRAKALRVLADGGLITATDTTLVRFDAAGNRVATYAMPLESRESISAITLDVNPDVAWVATHYVCSAFADNSPAHYMAISLLDGSILSGPKPLPSTAGNAIAVQGGWYAAVNSPHPTPRRRATR
jgi:hypothetical protein